MTKVDCILITPTRDEEPNLPRLADCVCHGRVEPRAWFIVDNGSTDGTLRIARQLAASNSWIHVLELPSLGPAGRGAPIVTAIEAALAEIVDPPEFFVNLDADVSFDDDYLERLLSAFSADSSLGIASGSCHEWNGSAWAPRYVTGSTVWGATRAYRWPCLDAVRPLEGRVGWDGIDEIRANARGWTTRTLLELPFYHHRREGERDGAWASRMAQGRSAHYMGYRPSYLVLRALFNAPRDRGALGLVGGYTAAAISRSPRCNDAEARRYLRKQQSPMLLGRRLREAYGRRG